LEQVEIEADLVGSTRFLSEATDAPAVLRVPFPGSISMACSLGIANRNGFNRTDGAAGVKWSHCSQHDYALEALCALTGGGGKECSDQVLFERRLVNANCR
jgi:hypothetical protein